MGQTQSEKDDLIKDKISMLSDDILSLILSCLTLNEAQKTCVLSKRWRYLWRYTTSLDFTTDDKAKQLTFRNNPNFIFWVNEVCSLIKSPSIDHFKVDYELHPGPVNYLDKWVDFAMGKGVKHLELELCTDIPWVLSTRPVSSGFNQLKSLVLKNINVSAEVINHFLVHCSSLELLSIERSFDLKYLRIGIKGGDPLHSLKTLKILNCYLHEVQICAPAPKLSSFEIQGSAWSICSIYIESAPLLSHMYIGGSINTCCLAFQTLSTQFSQIITLDLTLKPLYVYVYDQFPSSLTLSSLKELTVRLSIRDDDNLSFYFPFTLLRMSPFLQKLKVEIEPGQNGRLIVEDDVLWTHQHLKVLEVGRFVEHQSVVELVKRIYKAASHTLEKIVIDPMPLNTLPPSPSRILFTKQFEELFEEVVRPGIDQRIEIILSTCGN